ncbi:MAG: hypothetical protein LBD23_02420 [Oscillospiraceae bacterium]|nr:hypothetical protein [Oscillospiraceae bacterium]
MKVDASQVLGQGGVKIKAGTGTAADALKKGDVVRAEVVSSDKNGLLTLKMENGQNFNAKLGTDIKLSPGDVILLEVSSKDKNQISLSFSGVETADDDFSAPQANLVKGFSDKSLAPYAAKLAEHNIPVTEQSAGMMRELVARNPGLSLDEAAFLASNKLTGDISLMKAALSALAGGEKTDAMIARLLSLIDEQNKSVNSDNISPKQGVEGPKLVNILPAGGGESAIIDNQNVALSAQNSPILNQGLSSSNPVISTPLTEVLTMLVKNFGQGEATPNKTAQTIITQSDDNVQVNEENDAEILLQIKTKSDEATTQPIKIGDSVISQTVQNATDASQGVVDSAKTVEPSVLTSATTVESPETAQTAQNAADASQGAPKSEQAAQSPETTQTAPMGRMVADLLSNIPEFSGTPRSALQRFSEMLLRVAGENTETSNNSTETLTAQLNKLFTRIGKDDADAGARLRDAREELYTRLTLLEESISRAAQPARAELLSQTQKLMDHVRLLNSIEQFVYMQLPVQLTHERKAAELYVFKRKGGKRADPDNVNILLAIDLEFMGHWEALVNIKNKDVSIQMEVRGEAEKEHFNSNTVMLHRMLDDAGYRLTNTNIKFSQKETTPLTALSTLDRYTGGKQGIIDFKI